MAVEVEEKIITTSATKKRRIVQVAKEFHVSVESLVEFLKKEGFNVKNHMSIVTSEMYEKTNLHYAKESIIDSEDLKDDIELQRKDQEIRLEKERLESVREKIREISEVKPPTLEEVQEEVKEAHLLRKRKKKN